VFVKILSMMVAVEGVTLVGLLICGIKECEKLVVRKS
jgi:hypothetical protein